jgi:hypothetical protein
MMSLSILRPYVRNTAINCHCYVLIDTIANIYTKFLLQFQVLNNCIKDCHIWLL